LVNEIRIRKKNRMLEELDENLRQLLIAEMPIKNGEVEISFDQPKREWSARISKPTINLFMYDLRENNILRQHQWERLPGSNGGDPMAHLKRTPMRVDCFYMLTTWATVPEDEHRLMSRCLMTLFRFPILPAERLTGSLRHSTFEIPARLASHDKLTNPAEVWASLDNEMRPAISYVITLALDPWQEVSGPLVRTLTLHTGQSVTLPQKQGLVEPVSEMNFIGGTVMDRRHSRMPLSGIQVVIQGTGLLSITDQQGRFTLGSLPPGAYTLVAQAPSGKPQAKPIRIPEKEGNYDIELEV
jgi:hypothetical protein